MYILIESKIDFAKNLPLIQDNNILSLDVETTGLNIFIDRILSLQIGVNDSVLIYNLTKLDKKLITYLLQLIEDSDKTVIGHNIKFDIKFLYQNYGVMLSNLYDTMIGEILIFQGVGKQLYSLEELSLKYCNKVLNKDVRTTFESCDGNFTEQQLIYMSEDVECLPNIMEKQLAVLLEQKQEKVVKLESKLIPVVASMEVNGIRLNKDKWASLVKVAEIEQGILEKNIKKFIFDSLKFEDGDTAFFICEKLKIPVKTKALRLQLESITDIDSVREYLITNFKITSPSQIKNILHLFGDTLESTNEKVLKEYYKNATDLGKELIDKLLKFRELEKKISTYGENFFDVISEITNKAHFEFNQVGTATGRFSASRIHQVPKINMYREPFESDPGWKIITADYSQAELRLLGEVSAETKIIEACKNNIDLHKVTASLLFDKSIDEITSEERQTGKTLNFAVVYGTTEYGLAYNFGVTIDKAREYLEKFFKGYNRLAVFIKLAGDKIWEKKYSVTPLGRRRYWESKVMYKDMYEADRYTKRVKREGINHIIQGGSADITKIAMCNMYYNNPFGEDFKILMQVHDEIVCTAKDEIIEDAKIFVNNCMVDAEHEFLKETPCVVDVHVGEYWLK